MKYEKKIGKKWLKRPLNNRLGRKLWNEKACRFTCLPPINYVSSIDNLNFKEELDALERLFFESLTIYDKNFENKISTGMNII